MNARMRRLMSDYEQVKKDFAGHKYIIVTPVGEEPPEKYHVIYFVNGIYLLPDGRIETLCRHEVEITLHADYPRYKPICRILTPIWHPNFRDDQICIGDIWGAGETLTDIIVNIGDMIQYKSWNAFSPLSADAAQWAIENKHLFPVGNANLYIADYASAKDTVEIEFQDEDFETENLLDKTVKATPEDLPVEVPVAETPAAEAPAAEAPAAEAPAAEETTDGNDFEITAEELAGIEYVPTAQRMQSMSHANLQKGGRINFKTILVKGLLWALIGSLVGFLISEVFRGVTEEKTLLGLCGFSYMKQYLDYSDAADEAFAKVMKEYKAYCKANHLDENNENNLLTWASSYASDEASDNLQLYFDYDEKSEEALGYALMYEFDQDADLAISVMKIFQCVSSALWASILACYVGLLLGVGEGVYYGSVGKAFLYAAIGAAVASAIGFISGYLAQWMYSALLDSEAAMFTKSFVRGLGWSLMGLGIGVGIGLIRPGGKRVLFCALGGLAGGFFGGFLFNYVSYIVPNDAASRGVGIIIMGCLIGLGVGLLEQFAKQAWLKVIRGEFEGKEYLVFAGTTSIGNNGSNTIVLFKDKLVGDHHCDIKQDGNRFVLIDCGTPMGTVVNGRRVQQCSLRKGDAIAVGNSVLVFNTK